MSEKTKKAKTQKSAPRKTTDEPPVEMSTLQDAPMLSASEPALGTLSGEGDKEMTPPKKASRKKQTTEQKESAPPPAPTETEPAPAPAEAPGVLSADMSNPPAPEPLRLARGAFIAFRKSGGLHFTTREVVLYPDGKVAYDARGVPQKEYNRLRRALNDGQIISLRKLLDQINFWKTEGRGEQNPDAFAYEIAARLGQRSNELTVFDGSVPENLKPLIERLNALLPE